MTTSDLHGPSSDNLRRQLHSFELSFLSIRSLVGIISWPRPSRSPVRQSKPSHRTNIKHDRRSIPLIERHVEARPLSTLPSSSGDGCHCQLGSSARYPRPSVIRCCLSTTVDRPAPSHPLSADTLARYTSLFRNYRTDGWQFGES